MKKLVDLTGGARIGFTNASWPFARLTVSKKELRLRVKLIGKYRFSVADIEALEVVKVIPVLGKGIRIRHFRADYPRKIIFWTLNDPSEVIEKIQRSKFMNRPQGEEE